MYQPLDDSLKKIARGTGIAVVGMTLGLLFAFITRLIIARYGLQANYGTFSLALVVLQTAAIISSLGLARGATRYIAFFRSTGEETKVRTTMFTSLRFSMLASIVVGLVIFLTADAIAKGIFNAPDLIPALKIFAIGIPFFTLINTLGSFFRGFDRVAPGVFFQTIVLNAITLIILTIITTAGLDFITVFYAYLAAVILTSVILAIYTIKKLPGRIPFANVKESPPITRELLLFSLPLLGSSIISTLVLHTDTIMLGYFKTLDIVGLYNAAYPLAAFISVPLIALTLIYTPVATGLYSLKKMTELRRNYTVITKWLVSISLPIFLVMALFPEATLHLFFGQEYLEAAIALRILAIGFIINNLLGPNGETLVALGHPRFILWATLATAILNIILNIALIPPLGIAGAAIASMISLIGINFIRSFRLYSLTKIHPFSKNLFKPVIISIVLAFLIQVITWNFITVTVWMLPIIFILYCGIYGLAMLFTRSFDKEDIALLLAIEKRSGINAAAIKKLLRRFL